MFNTHTGIDAGDANSFTIDSKDLSSESAFSLWTICRRPCSRVGPRIADMDVKVMKPKCLRSRHLWENTLHKNDSKTVSKFIFFNLFAVFFNLFVAFFNLFETLFNLFVPLFNLSSTFLNLFASLFNLFAAFFNLFVPFLNLSTAFFSLFVGFLKRTPGLFG